MGFKFRIEYKSGASNRVADALSRIEKDDQPDVPSVLALFARPVPALLDNIRGENSELPDLILLHRAVRAGTAPANVSLADEMLFYKHRFYISRDSTARADILSDAHDSKTAGHPGEKRTFARIASSFFWPGMRSDIRRYVAACHTCQVTKYVTDKPSGLLQPLPIPDMVWSAASMDFIVGLPPSHGYTTVMVVVDRLTKYVHFGALKPGFDAKRVAALFVTTVVKLHGFPEKLLSDRDAIFMSDFWQELLSLSGSKLQFTTAYHPQTDGQSEVTNRGLEQYLRAFTFEQPKRWFEFLPWAELAMNCSLNVSIGMTPFKALYGRDPPNIFSTPAIPARHPDVASLLGDRTTLLRTLKDNLKRAQIQMTASANKHRRHMAFEVGDRVLLRLQPFRQLSVGKPISQKLGRRYYGPFEVVERIGAVAYRLLLPQGSRIHDVFHISLLKPFVPPLSDTAIGQLPEDFVSSRPIDTPIRATAERTVIVNGLPHIQWQVIWSSSPATSTWESRDALLQHFPSLALEDKAISIDGGVDRDTMDEAMQAHAHEDHDERRSRDLQRTTTRKERPVRKRSRPIRYRDFVSH